jgi:hypothetical protein
MGSQTRFDAFGDPMLVAKSIPRAQVEQFCSEVGGILSDVSR